MLAFRFDVDTRAGLVDRTPPLLDLLDSHGIRATFFVVMGHEAHLGEIVRLRFLAPKETKARLNVAAKGGIVRVARAALLPRGVGHRHPGLLRDVIRRGHELQPHGWSHIQWQRNLHCVDVPRHLRLAREALTSVTGREADGWASPGRSSDEGVLRALDEAGVRYAGDLDGEEPFVPCGHAHLQLPVTRFETIAQMRARGLSDDRIVATYLDDVAGHPSYCCLYEHPDDLGPAELAVFDRVFTTVRASGREVLTLGEVATRVGTNPSQ
ncbi:MAG: polysaccharide deacetylase family protein [Actinomycetota bacterium]|nr:polysaccharide deacetylase family protein [Actinomycetota bacterium]